MSILVTGSAGHLGEALVRVLRSRGDDVIGLDLETSPFTNAIGSIADRNFVRSQLKGVGAVLHTATLHKPHLVTHDGTRFIETNVQGTLALLEEAVEAGVARFVFTSSTSAFGAALAPAPGEPAAWITENVRSVPRNLYGVTKVAAEDLCELFHRRWGLACLVLRVSRFFPEADDRAEIRDSYEDANVKANEFLYRRVDLEDAVTAHLAALDRALSLGFARYIISATTPFSRDDLRDLRTDAPSVVKRHFPEYEAEYRRRDWRMFPSIDRVYVNEHARRDLDWSPHYDFARVLECLAQGKEPRSALARAVGSKGYHGGRYAEALYPVE